MTCTLTNNLPDIRTESKEEVELPSALAEKWKLEGRYNQEVAELDDFFEKSGLKRTPANYIIKWVTDYARETGIDGFRVDTVKHVEEEVWQTMNEQAQIAYDEWKAANPDKVQHDDDFFIVGELYGYHANAGRAYDFGSNKVDYFDYGYDAMINFGFKWEANMPYDRLFETYAAYRDSLQDNSSEPVAFMNYVSSHDDGQPFDAVRERSMESGTKLLLAPGMAQIYYGDETARRLDADAEGDAVLRSNMNWDDMDKEVLAHWQKLGKFRHAHPAVGAGEQKTLAIINETGAVFSRVYKEDIFLDEVVIGVGLPNFKVSLPVYNSLKNEEYLRDAYSGQKIKLINGFARIVPLNGTVLLERIE
jgi:alpha-amylase